jgi:hypothetical protein
VQNSAAAFAAALAKNGSTTVPHRVMPYSVEARAWIGGNVGEVPATVPASMVVSRGVLIDSTFLGQFMTKQWLLLALVALLDVTTLLLATALVSKRTTVVHSAFCMHAYELSATVN